MKKLIVFGLIALSAPSQGEEVHEIRDVKARSEIRIVNVAGEVDVKAWSRNQVEVDAELGRGVREFVFEVDGNDVLIEVKGSRSNYRNVSSDLVIKVPENSLLQIDTVSADIIVEDVKGRLEFESVSGDIEATVFESDVMMESVSGDISLQGDGQESRTRISSVSGDLEAQNLGGDIEATTVSANIALSDGVFSVANIETVNGDIVFHVGLAGASRINFETVNGDIDAKLSGKVSARFDIETFNGDIRNCFGPKSERSGQYGPGRELKFTEGEGKGRVVIRTLNGDLHLCRD